MTTSPSDNDARHRREQQLELQAARRELAAQTHRREQQLELQAAQRALARSTGRQVSAIRTRRTQAQARRVEAQQAAIVSPSPDRPALAGPSGTVQPLGGSAITPRARQLRAGVSVGGPVQFNQGVVAGPPLSPASPTDAAAASGISQLDFVLTEDLVEDGEIMLCFYQCERAQLVEVFHSPGPTVTTIPEAGTVINVGGSISIVLANTEGFVGDFRASIKLKAV